MLIIYISAKKLFLILNILNICDIWTHFWKDRYSLNFHLSVCCKGLDNSRLEYKLFNKAYKAFFDYLLDKKAIETKLRWNTIFCLSWDF